ncbi:FtsX-like permease family protein [Colwellia sp. MB02u-18]|nr:FtsX-like permease family protein [Colwellia sp. MB3u-45]MBA6269005.1 FtsX-like permease family protein [Colwellia sp. MB3u-43]MBA6320909.1 FtsX-like permease family protein [Colwellia sp. MB02u-19]MBA6324189.1 FtsX-like permease family protein [Colwellia sp. MB02u-18]MBA6332738.1 FtsX-like permease family protein [Colwellia sp. MB02u-12]MBA6346424.1 FtsX-like permease family protein [Colwellia sp. MB02u-1]
MWFTQSLRLLHHELRRGELTIIFIAIALAVATVFSLTGFSGQIKHAIVANSTNTIGADRVLRMSSEVDTSIIEKSQTLALEYARKIETESMAFAGDNMLLSELDAVSDTYPLRGELRIKTSLTQIASVVANAPKLGTVWVEPSVLSRLNVKIGEVIEIGVAPLIIAGIVTDIPDRSYRAFIAGPTVILNIADMPKTELIQPGSRITYKYLFAGETDAIESFEKWIKPQINESQRWYDAKAAQNRLSRILDTAEKFLSLASMLGIVLAAVAVAVASRRYGQRHQPNVSIFKALGASISHVRKLYCLHWTLLSCLSIAAGLVVGYGLLLLGANAIASYLSLADAPLTFVPFLTAIFTGLLCAIAFAIHPIMTLVKSSPLNVIRGFSQEKVARFGWHQLPPLLALFLLLFIFSQDLVMSAALLFGGVVVSFILLLFGRGLMSAGRSVGTKAGKSWHLALANLKRRASENSVQLVSFTIAIMLLLLITVMKSSILSEWEQQFPDDTPNHYLINITQDQIQPLKSFVEENNIANQGFYHVYRGRLSAINGVKTVDKDDKDDDSQVQNAEKIDGTEKQQAKKTKQQKTRQGMGRELGLTWRTELPDENEIIAGQWWPVGDETPQVSIESNIAERLAVKLGDELTFTLGSDEFTVPVTSIRQVNWQSRQLNFIMVFNQSVLEQFPTTSISAWSISDDNRDLVYRFLANFPTITVMDFAAIMAQLNGIIEQVTVAIQLILILVVLAGSLVLIAQVQASMEERERELAILRTLGAKGSLLRNSVLYEFVALGAIAGLMASVGMEIAVYILQSQVFNMSGSFHFQYWLVGIGAGAFFVGLIGMLSCWRLLKLSSVTLIRRTM